MGKRGKEAAPIPPGIQDLVNATLTRYGRGQPNANRPMATPVRSKAAPPQVNQVPPATPAGVEPATPASTPLKEPNQKKYRSLDSMPSAESLPRLPSFSASSGKATPRHSDTQTTIGTDVLDELARLRISGESAESLEASGDDVAAELLTLLDLKAENELQCSVCFSKLRAKQGFEKDGELFCGAECIAMAESDKARASGHARAGLLISDNGSIESIGESLQSQRSEESLQNLRSGESIQNLRSGESLQSQRSEESVDQGREEPPQEAEPDTDLGCTKEEEDAIMAELAQQLSPLGAEQPPSVAELEQQLPPEVPGPARLAEPNPDTQAQVTELKEQLRATQEMLQMLLSQNGSTSSTLNPQAVQAMLRRPPTQDIDEAAAKAPSSTPPASTPAAKACEKLHRFGLITKEGMKQLFDGTARAATNPPDSERVTAAAAITAPPQTATAKAKRSTAPDPAPTAKAAAPEPIPPAAAKAPALPQPERATAPDPAPTATTAASAAPERIPPAAAKAPALPQPERATAPDPAPTATTATAAEPILPAAAKTPASAPPAPAQEPTQAPQAPPTDPKMPTQADSAVPPQGSQAPAPTGTPPKASPSKPADTEETPEERAAREEKERLKKAAHAEWMRFNRRQRNIVRHLFEVFVSSNENWLQSSIVLNSRKKLAKRRRGKFIWITVEDWQLLRVFDGKMETTESDSEEDHIFEMGGTLTGTASYATALITDATPAILKMKEALSALQEKIGKANDETLETLNTNAEQAMKAYDEAVGTIKRSIAVHKPKPAKTKKAA
ncbi:hypothetical protein AK812_SmicGene12728 [Symbiodinium microadriaticum]|uniref:Uncharacterized protein n=1 Tax=Symbiodinium microadriaticum TaxID=2951 RepID=A0A1Q9E9T2_SYMMI|nr:hypothetical protein AK812_SmicGene12728 [Symbiodinium microadriaticum]